MKEESRRKRFLRFFVCHCHPDALQVGILFLKRLQSRVRTQHVQLNLRQDIVEIVHLTRMFGRPMYKQSFMTLEYV
jgi:hypothetical protein